MLTKTAKYREAFVEGFKYACFKISNENCGEELMREGKADEAGVTEKDVDSSELSKGIKVEREHISNRAVQKEIALDHLTEDPSYYTKLKKVEG